MVAGIVVALTLVIVACSSPERPTLVEQGQDAPSTAIDSAGDTAAASSEADGDGGRTGSSQASSPATEPNESGGTESGPTTTYPAITEDTTPPPPGLGAVVSPAGILVRVTGETASGYVVETPCGGITDIPWGTPIGPVQVVIDPGHGGDEEGAIGSTGLTEAELNLAVARRTAAELTRRSIAVVLTRNGDYRIPISRRAALADAMTPAAFVSIHHNTPASAASTTPGTEVFVQSSSDLSRRLGGLLYESVVAELSQFDVEWTARSDAGVLTVVDDSGDDAYGINRYPLTPAALIEMAYLGNPKEEALLATDDYLEVASLALADGIQRYLSTEDSGSGFVAAPRSANPQSETGGTGGCVDPDLE